MAEYWKSTPKYWCKHCSTFVKDTPFEKKQHEETGRHQGQLKRFLRGIQNDHEKSEREKQRAKAEVDRLNKAVGGGSASISTHNIAASDRTSSAPKVQASAADRKKQIQQLVDMGVAVPDEYRADMALAGDWKMVSQRKIEEPVIDESLNKGVRKRKYEGQDEEEEAGETAARRGWGSTVKRYPGVAGDDLDEILSLNPVKSKTEGEIVKKDDGSSAMADHSNIQASVNQDTGFAASNDNAVKSEHEESISKSSLLSTATEPPPPMFKKRKPKTSTT